MAILKQRLMKSKNDGTYDTIHLETTSDLVLHGDKTMSAVVGEMQTAINGKAASGHTHTPASIGAAATSHSHSNYVPTSRTVNGKALSANISLAASDVGAVPTTRKVCGKALSSDITITPNDIGAALADHTHENIGSGFEVIYSYSDYGTLASAMDTDHKAKITWTGAKPRSTIQSVPKTHMVIYTYAIAGNSGNAYMVDNIIMLTPNSEDIYISGYFSYGGGTSTCYSNSSGIITIALDSTGLISISRATKTGCGTVGLDKTITTKFMILI